MRKPVFVVVLVAIMLFGASQITFATNTVTLTTSIAQGTLLARIRNNSGGLLSNPTINMGTVVNSGSCRYGGNSLVQELGSDSRRLHVDNPNAAHNGWTLTIAPVGGSSALWDGTEGNYFDFNDAGGSGNGCTDNDGDGYGGNLSIDSTSASISTHCMSCSANHVSLSNSVESFSMQPSITIMSASSLADSLGSWYATGVDVSQTLPAGQEGDDYSLSLVLTAAAS